MNKIWLVFKHEYLHHVGRKRFITSIISLPLLILVVIAVSFISVLATIDHRPVGYVDLAGLFINAQPLPAENNAIFSSIEIKRFESEVQAKQSVEKGEIQGAFVIEKDYWESGSVLVIANEPLKANTIEKFSEFLRINLLREQPPALSERVFAGPTLVFRSLTDNREFHQNNIMGIVVPIIAGVLLVIAINISGGYLLQSVTEEKENRTIEMLVTSVSTSQLMVGKIIGNLSVGLTHLLIWALTGAGGVVLVMRVFPELSGFGIDLSFLGLMLITFLPAYIMVAALMAMVGSTAAEARDAQQIAGLFSIPVAAPLWFLTMIIKEPNSPLAIGLSLFPFTAPATLPMRGVLTSLPLWQVVLSVSLLVICAILALWLAGRAFRLGMLRYGKKITLRELLHKQQA